MPAARRGAVAAAASGVGHALTDERVRKAQELVKDSSTRPVAAAAREEPVQEGTEETLRGQELPAISRRVAARTGSRERGARKRRRSAWRTATTEPPP